MKPSTEIMLADWMRRSFQTAFPDVDFETFPVRVEPSSAPEFGDYQCNAAMTLAKQLKMPPRAVAARIIEQAGQTDCISRLEPAVPAGHKNGGRPPSPCQKLETAGPGFINIFLNNAWLANAVGEIGCDPRLGVPETGANRTVLIDYSSPNIAKPMHIGHIRSTVIGNALDRIFRFLGYKVISDNHLGDWGTQFGVLIMGYRNFLDEEALKTSPMEELERLYVKSYEKAGEDKAWLEQCRQELVKLQAGDEQNTALWQKFVQFSLADFETIYRRLGVCFDLVRGESYYRARLPGLVEELKNKKVIRESEGALVALLDEACPASGGIKLPPAIVRKSDGAFNYLTTDLATAVSRVEEFKPETIIYVTDERQQLHFAQLFAVCKQMGLTTGFQHVWFGLMRLPQGTFSTREGNVIKLTKLLDEAESRAYALVQELNPEMPESEKKEVARAIGIGSVKYADLSQNPQSVVNFSWDKALALNGNSAPYLQYTYARIRSVERKYHRQYSDIKLDAFPILFTEPGERLLSVKILQFAEIVPRAAQMYKPSIMAEYLFQLASDYNLFYQNIPFLKAPEGVRESRVRLGGIIAGVLKQGLNLLGIETPERI
jgi:arginyl-tRNA synthetase